MTQAPAGIRTWGRTDTLERTTVGASHGGHRRKPWRYLEDIGGLDVHLASE